MKELLVLGIGNRLMMDDGIGVYVAEELEKRNTNPGIRYIIGETDIYYCLNQIEEASYIIIIDAAYLGKKAGTVSIMPLQQAMNGLTQSIAAHDFHLLNEIEQTGKDIDSVFIGIEPYELKYGISLSPKLQVQFCNIVCYIEKLINFSYTRDTDFFTPKE